MFDAHSARATDEAMRRAGVTGARGFASRSEIVCDADGRPTGLLLEEEAITPLLDVLPRASFAERRRRLKAVLDAMASTGLCGGIR